MEKEDFGMKLLSHSVVNKHAQKRSFFSIFYWFCPLQHAFFADRLCTPLRSPFSHKPFRRGVYKVHES